MQEGLPPIKGFLPTSMVEWEGKLSCALFLAGCNFRCPFCHSGALVLRPDELETLPLEAVINALDANRGWIDGVVISGGEATTHPSLATLIHVLREHVAGIKLDTNGSRPDVVAELLDAGLVNCVAMDVKAPLDERYSAATGVAVDCAAILETIEMLRSRGIQREFRTTVVPGLHTGRDIIDIARVLGPTESLVLQQFAPLNCIDPAYLERRPLNREQLREMAAAACEFVSSCRVRGEMALRGAVR